MKPPRQPGRPKIRSDEDTRQRVFDAFEQLLVQDSTSTFSTADIARQAGVSKRTLYEVAPTKHALILGVMERARAVPLNVLEDAVESPAAALQILERFLCEWTAAAFAPTAINLVRLSMDEWRKAPELGAVYSEAGGAFTSRRLALWLAERKAQGHLRLQHPQEVADACRAILIKQILFSVAYGHRPPPSCADIRASVASLIVLLQLQPPA